MIDCTQLLLKAADKSVSTLLPAHSRSRFLKTGIPHRVNRLVSKRLDRLCRSISAVEIEPDFKV